MVSYIYLLLYFLSSHLMDTRSSETKSDNSCLTDADESVELSNSNCLLFQLIEYLLMEIRLNIFTPFSLLIIVSEQIYFNSEDETYKN